MVEQTVRKSLVAKFAIMAMAILVAFSLALISAQEAKALTDSEQRSAALNEAKRLLNTNIQYQLSYGATPCNYSYADCECFNRLAYKKAGIALQYSLRGQISQGVKTSAPSPGDLVFFDKNHNGSYGDGNDHTGVYAGKNAAGERTFIHMVNKQYDAQKGTVKGFSSFWSNAPYIFVDVASRN